jgi:hypothetical protein
LPLSDRRCLTVRAGFYLRDRLFGMVPLNGCRFPDDGPLALCNY